jgi:hypothetical protein
MSDITERTRASLPLRDYLVATGVLVAIITGNVLYCERRLATSEEATRAVAARVLALETDKKDVADKIDALTKTLNSVDKSVAVIEERTRKP